ncbi:hypothetical protein ACJA25_03350 [Mycoplasmopsis hyopharyngis]|uniref:hypothetical protein n=1 Tax=Mycoplasmopsis hyopharyngis TaxID=29558 RepID=UPI0038734F49
MKAIMKIQAKIFFKTKASYAILSIFTTILLTLSILASYFVHTAQVDEVQKLSSSIAINIVKYLFYVLMVMSIAYVAATIQYKYKNEGIELLLLTKSIKRRTIYFANLLLVFLLSLAFVFILWLCFFIPFLFVFKYFDNNVRTTFFTILLASSLITIFLSSLSSLVSISVDGKLFSFLLGSMPLIALTPFFIAQVFYGTFYRQIANDGLKKILILSKDSKANNKIINQEKTQWDTIIRPNYSLERRYDERGSIRPDSELEYKLLTNNSYYTFANVYKSFYPLNLFEYFDTISKLHTNNIYNSEELSYSYIAHVTKFDISKHDKSLVTFDVEFPKENVGKIKLVLATSKEQITKRIAPVTYYLKKNSDLSYEKEIKIGKDLKENKALVNKYFDFLSNFYTNVFAKTVAKEIELDKHGQVAKEKKEVYFAKMYENKDFQKEVVDFLVKEKVFRVDTHNTTFKWVSELEKNKNDFATFLNRTLEEWKELKWDTPHKYLLADFYKQLELFFKMTAMYSFYRYAGENNIIFENFYHIMWEEHIKNIFSFNQIDQLNIDNKSIPFELQEISNDSHYKVSVWVSIPWYISIIVLLSFSTGFVFLGNWKHNKKTFHI